MPNFVFRIDEFLRKLEFKFAGDWISGVNSTPRLEAMNNILKAIEQTDVSNVNDLINNDDIFSVDVEEFKRQISGNVYKKQYVKSGVLINQ